MTSIVTSSPVQTSYRAELRALAQVLARCRAPAAVFTDCNAIAKKAQRYQQRGHRDLDLAAPLPWEYIFDMIDAHGQDFSIFKSPGD